MNKIQTELKKSEELMSKIKFTSKDETFVNNIKYNLMKYLPFFRNEYFYRRAIKSKDDERYLLKLNRKIMKIHAKTDFEIFYYTPWLNNQVNGVGLPTIEKYNKFYEFKNNLIMRRIQKLIIFIMIVQAIILFIQLL
jgi:hypothetical protein